MAQPRAAKSSARNKQIVKQTRDGEATGFAEAPQAAFEHRGLLLGKHSASYPRASEFEADGRDAAAIAPSRQAASDRRPSAPHRQRHAAFYAASPSATGEERSGKRFVIKSDFEPKGDQPQAIRELAEGVRARAGTGSLGVTGSGKTFTMAKVIEETQRPALVLAPNKTLAAQLYGEFKSFFPDNAVEYFVSYYDYYQPEAYIPRSDTYIEKDCSINEQIDRMRHAATRALLERDDVIIVASVSCIYGIGSVETYSAMTFTIQVGDRVAQRQLLADLVAIQYKRNNVSFARGDFRVRGDTIESSRRTRKIAPGASACLAMKWRASPSSIR